MKAIPITVLVVLMLWLTTCFEARAELGCEATVEVVAPSEASNATPIDELTPLTQMALRAQSVRGAAASVVRIRNDTFSTPAAGDPIREIDLGDPSLGKLELRHLLGRRPEWAQVKNDGSFMSEWHPCPTQSAAGMSSRHGEELISLFIHAKGPIQKRNLPQPKIPDECEATIQAVTRVPYGQKPSPERELLPIVRSDVKRAKWAGGVLLVRNETVAFPPSGETVRDVDLGTGGRAELRHLPDRPPEWLWLSNDATPEAEVWNVCWSAESFSRTSENEIVDVVLHAPGQFRIRGGRHLIWEVRSHLRTVAY